MKCVEKAKEQVFGCDRTECRYFIKHQESQNCTFICVENNGKMSLRQVGEVLGTCAANINIIEKKAIKKILNAIEKDDFRE